MTTIDKAVADFLTYLEHERRSPKSTLRHYGEDVRDLAAFAASRGVRDFDGIDVRTLRVWLAHHSARSAGYRQRMIACIRTWQRWGLKRGLLEACTAEAIQTPRVPRPLPRVLLSAEQAARVVEAPDTSTLLGKRDRAILELLYGSGLRVAELCALAVAALDLDGGTARVVGKGNKERVTPLGGRCVEALRRWLPARAALPGIDGVTTVFVSLDRIKHGRKCRRARRPLIPRYVGLLVHHYGAIGGHPRLHPHALRAACVTHMLDGGADLRSLQELLGHARISTTELYAHVSTEHVIATYTAAHPLARRGRP
jgi:integrase/recombinase XerC